MNSIIKKIIFIGVLLLSNYITAQKTPKRLFFEDFESVNNWQQYFTGGGFGTYTKRVNNAPYAGGWCLRSNWDASKFDSILGNVGFKNTQMECRFGGLATSTPDTAYVRFFMRLDNFYWPNYGGKWWYFADDSVGLDAYFMGMRLPQTEAMTFSGNGATGSGWPSSCLSGVNGLSSGGIGYMNAPDPSAPQNSLIDINFDGKWHEFEFLFDYINDEVQFWVDGHRLTDVSNSQYNTNGKFPLCPGFHLRGIQFMYGHSSSAIATSRDFRDSGYAQYTGYAVGWQLDNIEVWDGAPNHHSTGLNKNTIGNELTIYPNPTNGNFTISFDQQYADDIVIEVTNMLGEKVYSEQLNSFSGKYEKQISLENYAKGVYSLQLKTKENYISRKIVKQ